MPYTLGLALKQLRPALEHHLNACTGLGGTHMGARGVAAHNNDTWHADYADEFPRNLGGPSRATIRVSPRLSFDTRRVELRYTVSNLQETKEQTSALLRHDPKGQGEF